jgi:hypothetical protein
MPQDCRSAHLTRFCAAEPTIATISSLVRTARMAQGIGHVLKRFQSLRVRIEEEVLRDGRFRSLCEDYGEAVEALKFWSRSPDARAEKRITEYSQLLIELEREILADLGQHPEELRRKP